VANNLTIESPAFEKIAKEAGHFTRDAINTLWLAENDTRAQVRQGIRQTSSVLEPLVLTQAPTGSVNNLDLTNCSIVSFTGTTAVNFTGMIAPETGAARVVFIQNSGTGTITVKHNATSEAFNQITMATGADYSMTTGKGLIVVYLASKWREVARSG
jgi:hypothetical protein